MRGAQVERPTDKSTTEQRVVFDAGGVVVGRGHIVDDEIDDVLINLNTGHSATQQARAIDSVVNPRTRLEYGCL